MNLKISGINKSLFFLGFFVAVFSAGIGIGGGAILVSTLSSVFKFDLKKATSISLATIVPITAIGMITHFALQFESIPWAQYIVFIPMCLLGARTGVYFSLKSKSPVLINLFILFILVASLKMLQLIDLPSLFYMEIKGLTGFFFWPFLLVFGFMIGVISSLLGVGCGMILVPFFVIFLRFDMHEAIKFSLTTMFIMTLFTTVFNHKYKKLDPRIVKTMLSAAIPGAIAGALISQALPAKSLKIIFGVFLFTMACRMLIIQSRE